MSTIHRAIVIATEAHSGMVDKAGKPYILHPLRLMLRMDSLNEMMAAVLHDVVEDSDWTLERLRAEGFDDEVVIAVDALTKREEETYEEFVVRASKNTIGKKVKIADLEDNLDISRINNPTDKDRLRMERYRKNLGNLKNG